MRALRTDCSREGARFSPRSWFSNGCDISVDKCDGNTGQVIHFACSFLPLSLLLLRSLALVPPCPLSSPPAAILTPADAASGHSRCVEVHWPGRQEQRLDLRWHRKKDLRSPFAALFADASDVHFATNESFAGLPAQVLDPAKSTYLDPKTGSIAGRKGQKPLRNATICDPNLRTVNTHAACGSKEDVYFYSPVRSAWVNFENNGVQGPSILAQKTTNGVRAKVLGSRGGAFPYPPSDPSVRNN